MFFYLQMNVFDIYVSNYFKSSSLPQNLTQTITIVELATAARLSLLKNRVVVLDDALNIEYRYSNSKSTTR